jgi:hypothetical protein
MDIDNKDEEKKLPDEIIEGIRHEDNLKNKVDWYGINEIKEETNNNEQDINNNQQDILIDEQTVDLESDTLKEKLVNSVNSMVSFLSSNNVEKDIQVVDSEETGYYQIDNVKIKDGIIYAKNVQDIITANIKPEKGNLWVVIPHTVEVNTNYSYKVELKYIVHNGMWWSVLPSYTKLENIEFTLFSVSSIKNKEVLSLSC